MKTAVRRVLLMSALMSPTALYALGLGEIRLNSALNQPFDAEIELVSAAQEDLAALRASLASSDTFLRYGLDKPSYLSEFAFRVVRSGGKDVLKVTSARPVTEPFVTLLVEANWPRGRLLREYTVLLDPPVFAPTPAGTEAPTVAPVASAPARVPAAAPVAAAPPPAPSPAVRESAPRRPVATATAEAGSTYRVQPRDTLWAIASAAYPGTRSDVNRAMVAIYESNPQAFGGNINVLRAGSELRMPSSGDVSAISASAAADEVARQYRLWREGNATATTEAADGGRLRLVTPEQGSAAPSTTTQPAASAAGGADLQSRVQQLEAELAEARRLLEVRNAELATLQGAAVPTEPAAAPSAGEAPSEAEVAAVPAEGGPAAGEPQAGPQAVTEPEPAAEPAAQPAAPAEEPAPGLLDRLGEYWWALLALLAAVLGIAVFLRRRRASASGEVDLEEALGQRPADLRTRAPAAAPREPSIVVEERKLAEPVAAKAAPAMAASVAAPAALGDAQPSRKTVSVEDTLSGEGPVSVEAGDPLAEADFHMAYGLYDQAADLVQVAAKREPQRRDLKLKLLEIFFVWGNKDRFLEVAREMAGSRASAAPGEWDKILIMGRQLAPDDPLFTGAVSSVPESLDMELNAADVPLDIELTATKVGTLPDIDLTGTVPVPRIQDAEGGLDFVLDEPVRGSESDDESLAPTIETPRIRAESSDEATAEVPIEELGLDVGDLEGLDDLGEFDLETTRKQRVDVEDTVERPAVGQSAAADEDLLSSTSIMGSDTIAQMIDETESGVIDLSDATGILPSVGHGSGDGDSKLEVTGLMPKPEFGLDAEEATMSEVGTKLDLARAYIDMGDPEGARSILDEVLKEGNPNQRKEAERLLAGLP